MGAGLYQRCWKELDEAERLAESDSQETRERAVALAVRVGHEARRARGGIEPSPWDDGVWAECTVLMTRASVLLLRLRRAGIGLPDSWSHGARQMPLDAPAEAQLEDATRASARSGVRRAMSLSGWRILVVEPDASHREQLAAQADAMDVPIEVAPSPGDAAARLAHAPAHLVACHFPIPGALQLVEALHRERTPIVIVTADPLRAISTFGFEHPILRAPLVLSRLVEQAYELAASRGVRPAAAPA